MVEQVVDSAKSFGIKVVTFSADNGQIPLEFLNSEAILVMTFDKLFNGKSIFGVDNADYIKIGSLTIDDAHTIIKKVQAACTLTIPKRSDIYKTLLSLFAEGLNAQKPFKLNTIKNEENSNAVMKVPYWVLDEKKTIFLKLLSDYAKENTNLFQYPFILEMQDLLNVYVSGQQIDIRPQHMPVAMIPSFSIAKHRLFLSATLSNAGAFISELGVQKKAVDQPLRINALTDTGEKWLLACQKINSAYSDEYMRGIVKKINKSQNVLILVPSTHAALIWQEMGAKLYNASNIDQLKTDLRLSKPMMAVLANKYDGIDLPEDLCHLTVLDGVPFQSSLADRADAQRFPDAIITSSPIIREVEQGMGRSVRSKADYSLILVLGNKLQDLMYTHSTLLTPETLAQWEFFKEISQDIKNKYPVFQESNHALNELIQAVFSQDASWSDLYKNKVQHYYEKILLTQPKPDYSFEQVKREAWDAACENDYDTAVKKIRNYLSQNSPKDIGSVYELLASYAYKFNKQRAFDWQKKAHSTSPFLFKSPYGSYAKRSRKNGGEGINYYQYLQTVSFTSSNDVATHIRSINDDLVYANYADENNFRLGIQRLGQFLGFDSSQPESETALKEGGPDNLWLSEDAAIVIEDKNQRTEDKIYKDDIEQITTSSSWFTDSYQVRNFTPLLFHRSKLSAVDAHTNLNIRVVNDEKLSDLKLAVNNFADRISQKPLDHWTETTLQQVFQDTNLLQKTFIDTYTVPLKKYNN
ncbi:helicase C-terminal domain-containing protein [Oenococcus sp.]|uniref:helicase C-terminal domain-containing protein n=1 Tax=Oenococcus sp. TaxID=1979414 RepID=UPI0039E87D9E